MFLKKSREGKKFLRNGKRPQKKPQRDLCVTKSSIDNLNI